MSVKTYNPAELSLVIGGRIIKSWNTVAVSRDEDGWTFTVGTTGEVTRTKNLSKLGGFTITLPQTSEDNAALSAFEITGGVLSCALIDKSGYSVALLPEGTVVKQADSDFGKESGEREWSIKGDVTEMTVGGN